MTTSYYGCTANHAEFTCLSASYHVKRFKNRSAWCENCQEKYPEKEATDAVDEGTEVESASA